MYVHYILYTYLVHLHGVKFVLQSSLVLNFRAKVAMKLQFDTPENPIPVFHNDYWQCDWREHWKEKYNNAIERISNPSGLSYQV